jgi:hypothetical protein
MLNTLPSMPRCFCLADGRNGLFLALALSFHNSLLPLIRSISDWPSQRPHHATTSTCSKSLSCAAPFSNDSFLARFVTRAALFHRSSFFAALFLRGSFLLRLLSLAALFAALFFRAARPLLLSCIELLVHRVDHCSRHARAHACEPPHSSLPAQTSSVGGRGAGGGQRWRRGKSLPATIIVTSGAAAAGRRGGCRGRRRPSDSCGPTRSPAPRTRVPGPGL